MPYDDSNIKKMIRYQTERKVGFSKSRRISSEVKSLIHHMLDANPSTRYTVAQVMDSAWLRPEASPAAAAEAMVAPETSSETSWAPGNADLEGAMVIHGCPQKAKMAKKEPKDKPPATAGESRGQTSGEDSHSHTTDSKPLLPTALNKHLTKAAKGKTCSSKGRPCPCPNCQRERMATQAGWMASPPRGHQSGSSRGTSEVRPVTPHHQHRGHPQQEPRDRVWRTDLEK